jgi:hypothetical protein
MARKASKPVKKSRAKSSESQPQGTATLGACTQAPDTQSGAPKRRSAAVQGEDLGESTRKNGEEKPASARSGRLSKKSSSRRGVKPVAKKTSLTKVPKKTSIKSSTHAAGKTPAKPASASSAKNIPLKPGASAAKALSKANGKGGKAAPGAPPAVKPSPGEIAARLSAKRRESLAEGKVRSGKNGSVECAS